MMRLKTLDILGDVANMAMKRKDERSFSIGAFGLRSDGVRVRSYNGSALHPCQATHAETRLCSKLDVGSIVWVARRTRDGELALAKPCPTCESIMRRRGVKRVIYSTGPGTYGQIDF